MESPDIYLNKYWNLLYENDIGMLVAQRYFINKWCRDINYTSRKLICAAKLIQTFKYEK